MTPEEVAAVNAEQEKALRDLAAQIASMTKLGFDPLTIRKGIVTAVTDFADPPTVAINISGDQETTVSEVRTLNNYTPLVGQTVLIAKQGTEIFLLGSIASVNPRSAVAASEQDNGWMKAELSNGTHGGSEGDVYYRRVMDHGSWKMQWRGIWNTSGATEMISAGGLDPNYRPASYKPILCARNSAGSINIRVDFHADGSVKVVTGTPGIAATTVGTNSANTASTVSHSHGGAVATSTITHDDGSHSHTVNSHSHGGLVEITYPTWISLNGVEYYL